MNLSSQHQQNLERFVPIFRDALVRAEQNEELLARFARQQLYKQLLSPEALQHMSELEFGQVIGSLWASRQWGNKRYLIERLIAENGLQALVKHLHHLLWSNEAIAQRYNAFRRAIKGLGAASITELLAFVHPNAYGIWNDKARIALHVLGLQDILPFTRKSQISGDEYQKFNALLACLRDALAQFDLTDLDFPTLDYFLYLVWEQRGAQAVIARPIEAAPAVEDFDHEEIVEHLIEIGQWLGFTAEKEKMVARGARVDAIWQARIANLGVVTYVFEVQRRGSVDSLILNLQRAQNNPTVQRLIVVANAESLERIRHEIASLPESFRKLVGFMEVQAVLRANELIGELAEIIGRLALVRSEFDVPS